MTSAAPTLTALLASMKSPRLTALFAQDPARAAQWVGATASDGLPAAQVCYGCMLLEGTGVERDVGAAFDWFGRAAEQGYADALGMRARCLENGWGTSVDLGAAFADYRRAAELGSAWAQYHLGHLYLDGRGVTRDATQAYMWYLKAAEQGHERAMSLAGRCCEEGWGTSRNLTVAGGWYRRSAEAGYFRGQYHWASLLLTSGHHAEAAYWLERAAAQAPASMRQAIIDLAKQVPGSAPLRSLAARLGKQMPEPDGQGRAA